MYSQMDKFPKDRDGKILLFTGVENFGKFYNDFLIWSKEAGLSSVVRDEPLDIHNRPVEALERISNGTGNHDDENLKRDYIKSMNRWEDLCEKFLEDFMRTLGSNIRDYVEGELDDMNLATRANIKLIIETVRLRFGTWSSEIGELNFMAGKAIPVFKSIKDVNEGVKKLTELIQERTSWGIPEEAWTDVIKQD